MVGQLLFGLDTTYINEIVEQLENSETVLVKGCNDPDGFMEYLSDERNIECDCQHKDRWIQLTPVGGDWGLDDLPY